MAKELTGLEFLKKKEIKNMKCNMNKEFVFISYSHDDHDSQIVMNVFKKLMEKGYNMWIDTANMPADENTWKKSAMDAMRDKNCKFAFYFRSENSMKKETIAKELETLKKLNHIKKIVAIDIWLNEKMSAETYYDYLLNDGGEDFDACERICEVVSKECKAIRLVGDVGNDISSLVEEMEDELKNNGVLGSDPKPKSKVENEIKQDVKINKPEVKEKNDLYQNNKSDENPRNSGITQNSEDTIRIVSDGSVYHKKGKDHDAFYRKNESGYTVLKGSKLRYNEKWSPKTIWEQNKNYITEEGILLRDISNLAISTAGRLIEGMSTNGSELDSDRLLMEVGETYVVSLNSSGAATKIEEAVSQKNDYESGIIKIVSDGSIYHIKGKDGSYDAFYRKNESGYTVLRGSKLKYSEKWSPKTIWEQNKNYITEEGILLRDISNLPISTAGKLIEGISTNGSELDSEKKLMQAGETFEVSLDSTDVGDGRIKRGIGEII